jgi:hypothetical protein
MINSSALDRTSHCKDQSIPRVHEEIHVFECQDSYYHHVSVGAVLKRYAGKTPFSGVNYSTLVLGAQLSNQAANISAGCVCLQPLRDEVSDLLDFRQGNCGAI